MLFSFWPVPFVFGLFRLLFFGVLIVFVDDDFLLFVLNLLCVFIVLWLGLFVGVCLCFDLYLLVCV